MSAPGDAPPQGRLHDGSRIPLSHSGSFPSVEQTLAAVSTVLNGGGLARCRTSQRRSVPRSGGREQDLRSLIGELDRFAGNVNDQTDDIIAATDSLNRLSGTLAANRPVLDQALKNRAGGAGGAEQ